MGRLSRHSRRLLTALAAASLLTTMGLTAGPAGAAPPGSSGGSSPTARPASTAAHDSLMKSMSPEQVKHAYDASPANKLKVKGDGPQTVFVQLSATGAATVSAHTLRTTKGTTAQRKQAAKNATLAARAKVAKRADALAKLALGTKAKPLYTVSNALPGFAIRATPAQLKKLAAQKDVVKISAIVPKKMSNAYPAQLTKVLNTWQDLDQTGDGIKVGIIDTGIDYTHADFGGPGTEADYEEAKAKDSDLTYDWRADLPPLAQAKIAGGYDFVGDDYDANPDSANYQPIPHPDPNPLDCNSHGTHVSGTVAGYGEFSGGATFTGDYGTLTAGDLNEMEIGPGMAPGATLYAFKVFGCDGSTDVVIEALDAALDPDGDGDFSDSMDIVNLSLGGDYATPDDPENDVVNKLAENGVLPVIAMGNGGDLTDIGGAPGNAVRSLAVASSVDAYQLLSGIKVNAPAGVAGTAVGQISDAYPWTSKPDVTGAVVELSQSTNKDGCNPLDAADKAAVSGKIAWLTWDSNDATRRCGSAGRAANVKAAGAIGAVFTGDVPVFSAGILGDASIPVFQLTLTETQKLKSAADAGTLNITFTKDLVNNQPSTDPSINDLVSSFSSRGTHGSIGVVKPDVTAPGDTIVSAGMGTGDGVLSISGTSMATPHTAGIAALVKATHPDWTTEQLKAAIMNSADHDLYTKAGQTGDIYGPARVGAGRVDALNAVTADVVAYSADVEGGVSASFGVVEVPAGTTRTVTRNVTVRNASTDAVDLNLAYKAAIKEPGVSYSVKPATLHLAAGRQQNVTVTLTAVSSQLRHSIDPTMDVFQADLPRQFVSDASGWLTLARSGRDDLRVPVYGAVKPVSTSAAAPGAIDNGTAVVTDGAGFDQGGSDDPSAWTSLVSVMQFGAESPKLPNCPGGDGIGCTVNQTAKAGDIQYVGAGVSPDGKGSLANGWLWFGVSTYADWATIGNSTVPYVDFDTNGDGKPDYEVYAQNVSGTDVLVAWLVDIKAGKAIDAQPVNMNWGDVDTNVFDSNVVLLPVWPAKVGITDGTTGFPLTYTVGTNSAYTSNASGDIDEVGPVAFDAGKPKVKVDGPLWLDGDGYGVPVNVSAKFTKTLVFHLHNASGTRAQMVLVSPVQKFTDVPKQNPFYDDIMWLVASGITNGTGNGSTYSPAKAVGRAEMAAFIYRYLHPGQSDASCTGSTRTFTDVPASNQFCGDIEWLAANGIANGTGHGAFSPKKTVTRDQMAMFIYRAVTRLGDVSCGGTTRTFTDVPAGMLACGDIEWLAANGIVNGTGGGKYAPGKPVYRGEMAAFLHRASLHQS